MTELCLAVAQTLGAAEDLEESVRSHVRIAACAVRSGVQLLLFPELSLTGYHTRYAPDQAVDPRDPRLQSLQALVDAEGITIAVGAPLAAAKGLNIGLIILRPRKEPTTYRKRYLGGNETDAFVPGGECASLELPSEDRVAFAICADITHPEHAMEAARDRASVYATSCLISVEAYGRETELLKLYAREHQMMVMMANYAPPVPDWMPAGRSAIWSAKGTLLACARPEGEALVIAQHSSLGWQAEVLTSFD